MKHKDNRDYSSGGKHTVDHLSWKWNNFTIGFTAAGRGPAVVLIHAIYPGASSAQWKLNSALLARRFRVYVPDLIGFGRSSRPKRDYDPNIYTEMIAAFLRDVVGGPAIVVVSGQSAPFAISVAATNPELITHLVLDTPTGLSRFSFAPPLSQKLFYQFLKLPIIGDLAYSLIVSKRAIRVEIANEVLARPDKEMAGLVEEIYRETHQPGAKWAPMAMLGGRLNVDIRQDFSGLKKPILLVWGESSSRIPLDDAEYFLEANKGAVLRTLPRCRLMPEYEHAKEFNSVVEQWLQSLRMAA